MIINCATCVTKYSYSYLRRLHQAEGDASQREKLKLGNKLKESLREGIGTVATETMFLIRFPDITEHKFHDHIQVSNTLTL